MPDVMILIRVNQLSLDYGDSWNPYVAGKFQELWHAARVSDEA